MSKFKAALQDIKDRLYGQNIELTNWHLNGDTEPFDNFADNNGWFDNLDDEDHRLAIESSIGEIKKHVLNLYKKVDDNPILEPHIREEAGRIEDHIINIGLWFEELKNENK